MLGGFTFANNGNTEPKNVQQVLTNEIVDEQQQKITSGCTIVLSNGITISCTNCQCSDLIGFIIKK